MDRPLQISYKDTTSSEFLERQIRERVAHLEKLHPHIIGCRVVVEVPHRSAAEKTGKPPIAVSVEIDIPGHPMIVARDERDRHEMKNDQYAVVTHAFRAAERQLKTLGEVRTAERRRAAPEV